MNCSLQKQLFSTILFFSFTLSNLGSHYPFSVAYFPNPKPWGSGEKHFFKGNIIIVTSNGFKHFPYALLIMNWTKTPRGTIWSPNLSIFMCLCWFLHYKLAFNLSRVSPLFHNFPQIPWLSWHILYALS